MANGIMEKMAADIADIKEMLEGMNGTPASSKTEDKPKATEKKETAAQKKAREKKEAKEAAPDFTAEELRDKFLAVQEAHGDAAAKELITGLGYDKLAKLIADASNWQASWDAAEAKLEEEPAADDDNGGL